MKKFYALIFLLFAIQTLNAQDWKWLNPLPTGNTLNSTMFSNSNTGFAVGDCGVMIKTDDAGNTWKIINQKGVTNGFQTLNSVHFTSTETGYAVGNDDNFNSLILKTTDGGTNWVSQNSGSNIILNSVSFFNPDNGFVVGRNGTIMNSTDGGINWVMKNSGTNYDLSSIFIFNDTVGFITGSQMITPSSYITIVLKTTDGGKNWTNNALSGNYHSITFTDINTGYLIGHTSTMKTINGGISWSGLKSYPDNSFIYSACFVNQDIGFAVGGISGAIILKTTDGGLNWNYLYKSSSASNLKSVYFINQDTGYAVGGSGIILKTTNGGLSWMTSSSNLSISSLYFLDSDNGYAVTGTNADTILKTTDGGNNWMLAGSDLISTNDICFVDINIGFAVGWNGAISKTTDGGKNWEIIDPGTGTLNSVYFIDSYTGFAAGNNGTVIKTTDSGLNWVILSTGTSVDLKSVFFTDSYNGYAVGYDYYYPYNNVIIKTTDGGINWDQKEGADINLNSVYFSNINTGYIAAGKGKILKSTDAGNTWVQTNSGISNDLKSVYFLNSLYGYISGDNGTIIKTSDGGTSWEILNSGVYYCNLNTIQFINDSIGFAAGAGGENGRGVLLKTTNGGGNGSLITTGSKSNISHDNIKIYPSPATKIISIDMESNNYLLCTYLYIYNIQGQLLMIKPLKPGKTDINIERLSKGIYMVKIPGVKRSFISKIVKE